VFEHRFAGDRTVTFRALGGGSQTGTDKPDRAPATKYEIAPVRDDVWAVSYLSSAGYTLTVVLDLATKKLVAFSSNEKMLAVQHGTFETAGAAESKPRDGTHAGSARH
jgi:hypothetical protein